MIERIFWLAFVGVLAVLGLSYLKNKTAQNTQHFSADALIERLI